MWRQHTHTHKTGIHLGNHLLVNLDCIKYWKLQWIQPPSTMKGVRQSKCPWQQHKTSAGPLSYPQSPPACPCLASARNPSPLWCCQTGATLMWALSGEVGCYEVHWVPGYWWCAEMEIAATSRNLSTFPVCQKAASCLHPIDNQCNQTAPQTVW